jgi:hypothetical protein
MLSKFNSMTFSNKPFCNSSHFLPDKLGIDPTTPSDVSSVFCQSENNSLKYEAQSQKDSMSPESTKHGIEPPVQGQTHSTSTDRPPLKDKKGKVSKRPYETRLRISNTHRQNNYKPVAGIKKGQTGPDHPSYKTGEGENRVPQGETAQYKAWQHGVRLQANFKCFLTGETDTSKMHCHHLDSWSSCPEKSYDVKNGILISQEVHKRFHGEYGPDVSRIHFERFLRDNNLWGDQPFPWEQGNHEPSPSVEELVKRGQTYRETLFNNFVVLCT